MKKRKWVYAMQPSAYEISCDKCGGEVQWSEFEKCVWCPKCQIDTPGTGGIFDGPIPMVGAKILGISFDRINLQTGKRLRMKIVGEKLEWMEGEDERSIQT